MKTTKNKPHNGITYDPGRLLDSMVNKLKLKNDAALCRALNVAPPVISKIRNRKLSVGASIMIRMLEVSDFSLRDLRTIMGDRREKYRVNAAQFGSDALTGNGKDRQQ